MKIRNNRGLSGLAVLGLILISQKSYAGLGEKFNQYVGSDFSNASGFYIILGVIGAGIVGKICQYYFMREEEKPISKIKIANHAHHRQHRHRSVIKKTS